MWRLLSRLRASEDRDFVARSFPVVSLFELGPAVLAEADLAVDLRGWMDG